jgi:hypothetical protein
VYLFPQVAAYALSAVMKILPFRQNLQTIYFANSDLVLRNSDLVPPRVDCLKGNIFITAGHRPADLDNCLSLPERQDFKHKTTNKSCPVGQWSGVYLFPQVAAYALPAVMKILPFRQKTANNLFIKKNI